ncbi:MAG: histone deacetylase [Planctomycetaceae bacterium]|nr:histone deacetylase [Planctomycetaceae bacterium]
MGVLFTDRMFIGHETGAGHPESPRRLHSILQMLELTQLDQRFERGTIRPATFEEIALVHDRTYVGNLRSFASAGGGHLESDTVCGAASFEIARHAAGAALAAVDAVMTGEHRRASVLARPPGHHALPARAMGFCLFANIAIAARYAQQAHGVTRVLIVDWDVHHGNGTQDIFYDDPDVTFFSAHRFPFYPGSGDCDETGVAAGIGTTFNLPLCFGISRREYRERFHTMLADAAARSKPELVLVSAGYDAHAADPIGSLGLESEDFGDLTELVVDVANQHCGGKLVSLLEGGYDVSALAESVECHLTTLLKADAADAS